MKRHFFKYNRQFILFWLNIILFFCIYIITRDSELLIFHFNNGIDKYIERLFLKTSNDNTLYNIAISYVAAYIFYIIQIHIPAIIKNNHGINLLKTNITKSVNNIKLLLLLISELTERNPEGLFLKDNISALYIIEEKENQIFKITFLDTYITLKDLISAQTADILSSNMFSYLDNNLSELFSSLPIDDLFVLADNIYNQKQKHTHTVIIENGAISITNSIINELDKRYSFSFETYHTTDNLIYQSKYIGQHLSLSHYTNNELEIKVKLT